MSLPKILRSLWRMPYLQTSQRFKQRAAVLESGERNPPMYARVQGARVGRKLQSAKERQHLAWWLGGFGLIDFGWALHVQCFVRTFVVEQVDNATPIILNLEKSVTLGILGTLALWRSTKLSPGMGEPCSGAASMRIQELGSWRSRNGCSIRWLAAVCVWRRCPRSAVMHCWI